jgi:cobyrinic acid a,c-diamide synthase
MYAEGGGAAYLCQHLVRDKSAVPMVGILPASAVFTGKPLARPQPVVLECHYPTWIASAGDTIRGYRTGAWQFIPHTECARYFKSDSESPEILVRHHCVGSTVHLNFAAQPRVLEAFFARHAPSLSIR